MKDLHGYKEYIKSARGRRKQPRKGTESRCITPTMPFFQSLESSFADGAFGIIHTDLSTATIFHHTAHAPHVVCHSLFVSSSNDAMTCEDPSRSFRFRSSRKRFHLPILNRPSRLGDAKFGVNWEMDRMRRSVGRGRVRSEPSVGLGKVGVLPTHAGRTAEPCGGYVWSVSQRGIIRGGRCELFPRGV